MRAFKRMVLFSVVMLASNSGLARDQIDDLVERMNPPKSIEDPRNAICAKNDRGFMRYSNHDVIQRAEKSNVQLALYKWGRLHFPNARDAQKCPILNLYQLTLHWRSAYELPTGTGMWDEVAMEAFDRLASASGTYQGALREANGGKDGQKSSGQGAVKTAKSMNEFGKSDSMEIFGLKIGEPFKMANCHITGYKETCIDYRGTIMFAEDRSPAMVMGGIDTIRHEGLLAGLSFLIKKDDENISKFIEKFGKPSIEVKPVKNENGVAGDLKIYRWSNASGLIRIDCNSLIVLGCSVHVTSQEYIKFLQEKESQRQPL